MPLLLQLRKRGEWVTIGTVHKGDPLGSMSHNGPAGRQVYAFGCYGDHSIIQRSRAGIDIRVGTGRLISTKGFEQVARLTPEYPYEEFYVKTDIMLAPTRFRFHHTR